MVFLMPLAVGLSARLGGSRPGLDLFLALLSVLTFFFKPVDDPDVTLLRELELVEPFLSVLLSVWVLALVLVLLPPDFDFCPDPAFFFDFLGYLSALLPTMITRCLS